MGRTKRAPDGFVCPYRDNCPHLEGLSAFWMFKEYQCARLREHEHWQIRQQMAGESEGLRRVVSEQKQEIERLKAENKLLHQSRFKSSKARASRRDAPAQDPGCAARSQKCRGAPKGHPPWTRKVPERIDRHIHVEAPLKVIAEGGELTRGEVLRVRVRYFCDGAILGSRAYVEELLTRRKAATGLMRRTGASKMKGGVWEGLHTLRALRTGVYG